MSLQEVIKDRSTTACRIIENNNIEDDTSIDRLSDQIDGQDALIDLDESTLNLCIGAGNELSRATTLPRVATNPSVSLAQLAAAKTTERELSNVGKKISKGASRFIDSEFGKTSTAGLAAIVTAIGSYQTTKAWNKPQNA
jgi:hypothetical protein